jgi:hypothetical protein
LDSKAGRSGMGAEGVGICLGGNDSIDDVNGFERNCENVLNRDLEASGRMGGSEGRVRKSEGAILLYCISILLF